MKRLVLIDGVNFFYRGSWTLAKSYSLSGSDVTYVRCFITNLLNMIKKLGVENTTYIVCWDGGYTERMRISSQAVKDGIIPKTYKQERRDARDLQSVEEQAQAYNFAEQMKVARQVLSYTIVGQNLINGEEADDLVGSYAKKYASQFDEVFLVTTDRDYYQLLDKNVKIYNSGKNEYKDIDFLRDEYNLSSGQQWVDVGALAGESGVGSDTIYGVPGIGYTIAAKLISQYGTLDNLISSTKQAIALDLKKFNNDAMALHSAIKSKQYKMKTHIKEASVLAYENVVLIARQLKQMRTWLDVKLPEVNPDWVALNNWCITNGVPIKKDDLSLLTEE